MTTPLSIASIAALDELTSRSLNVDRVGRYWEAIDENGAGSFLPERVKRVALPRHHFPLSCFDAVAFALQASSRFVRDAPALQWRKRMANGV